METETEARLREIDERLERWSVSLCKEFGVHDLIGRSPIAHKWRAPYRSAVIRECLLWRMHDLGRQIMVLTRQDHVLGARILLRSSIETLAILIFLNDKTQSLLDGNLTFHEFDQYTRKLMMGSRNGGTSEQAINVMTILPKADRVHPGLLEMHNHLSESAHPNYDGVIYGYASPDPARMETHFANRWADNFGPEQEPAIAFVLAVFEFEYNETWHKLLLALETWLRDHDDELTRLEHGGRAPI